jgi:UDP-N-acetylmuramoyl-L-alanyl-D-glutamate--2,6-diaminopimelate ligase
LASLSTTITPLRYSLEHRTAEVYADINRYDCHGCALSIYTAWGKGELQSPLFGQFNVSNLLAALTVLLHWGEDLSELLSRFEQLRTVPGRMERFGQVGQPTVIIDYAHTPDALEKTLLALRAHLASNSASKLWCIFGCGGNRDKGKRPLMGEVAQRLADKVIITDDNPRHESSQAIINDILPGCPIPEAIIPAREQAIRYAIAKANEADIILVAGKGHEDYQQIGEQRIHYSDRELVATLLAGEKFGAIRLGI